MKFVPMIKKNLSSEVKEYLYNYIKNIDVNESNKLPSEVFIAEKLSVSRVTVRRALDDLEKEGIVLRIHGKGTFVNTQTLQINLNLNPGNEFHKLIHDSGYKATVKVLNFEITNVDKKMAENLQINEGDRVIRVEKVFFADGHPAIVCIDTIPCSLFSKELTQKDLEISTFDVARNLAGKIATRDRMEMSSMTIQKMKKYSSYAQNMQCDSVLSFDVINYDQDNKPIFFDKDFYDTNYIRFSLIRSKNVYF